MRLRTTFFPRLQAPVDPARLQLTDAALAGPTAEAAREDRATLSLDQLPSNLARLLGDSVHELHVRWASPQPYESVSPLYARLAPGLHVFYTPQAGASDAICPLLQTIFGASLDCRSLSSFTLLGGGRFSHSAAYQYYAPLDDLAGLTEYVRAVWCPGDDDGDGAPCPLQADGLAAAAGLDLSYDAISHTFRATTFWPVASRPVAVDAQPGSRVEIGILTADSPPAGLEPFELALAGHVAVLGQDDYPSPVAFSFPSRHRHADGAAFSAAFLQPAGLHPTLQLRIASRGPPREGDDPSDESSSSCRLHAYFTLPRHIFADRYQLEDPLFLASKNLSALRHTTQPVDLEAPDYAVSTWGSAILLELAPPAEANDDTQTWTTEIPLHLRYLLPADGGYRTVDVPYPTVFWACAAEDGTKFATNPFDRVNLGYDGLFGPRTEFWHVTPAPALDTATLKSAVRVPVLDARRADNVQAGTAAVVLLGFVWVLWKLLAGYRGQLTKTKQETEKKTQ